MHKQVDWLAGERVAGILAAKQIVAIEPHPASSRDSTRRARELEELLAGNRVETIRVGTSRHKDAAFRRRHMEVALQIMFAEGIVANQDAVVATEPVAGIVA